MPGRSRQTTSKSSPTATTAGSTPLSASAALMRTALCQWPCGKFVVGGWNRRAQAAPLMCHSASTKPLLLAATVSVGAGRPVTSAVDAWSADWSGVTNAFACVESFERN